MSKIDWPALMRLGLVGLRLTPDAFWALTPAELSLMAEALGPAERGLSRAGLRALMQAHPDAVKPD
ncbi:phage tail assembly chaperone [Abyssibius alkaniclasticus]|uniref:rcc01693 family protein n=1 Tax=Abyssibius alkaniclasticus TaxID=2881234 RepID=UPI002363F522|nr:rcc01693 family protein [Abyssibius alkaniclasticus]UPH70905.1 phage tail assembly chaperone [Abyssibius alkaniclasticus]|tara:strand:- start:46 stop:243 length:198 start_codon:yes stop_codon:yes gene_type:complete